MKRLLLLLCFPFLTLCATKLAAQSFKLLDTLPGLEASYTQVDEGYGAAGVRFLLQGDEAYRIEQVTLPLTRIGALRGFSLTLQADADREPSGVPIDSFVIVDGELQDTPEDIVFQSMLQPVLEPERSYWLVLESQSTVRWQHAGSSDKGLASYLGFYREDSGKWYRQQYGSAILATASVAETEPPRSYIPLYYHAWVENGPEIQRPWPDENSAQADITLFEDKLAPGQHMVNVQIVYEDGYLSPVVSHQVHIEPGPENRLLSYRIADNNGEVDDGHVLSDDPEVDIQSDLARGQLQPGPHTLILQSGARWAEGYFPTYHSIMIEPKQQRHFNMERVAKGDGEIRLIDELGEIVYINNLGQYDEDDPGLVDAKYTIPSTEIDSILHTLALDHTYRIEAFFSIGNSKYTSSLDNAPALYRQQDYSDWIYEVTGEYRSRNEDLDDDGLSNLQEWYFKTDPLLPDYGHAPTVKAVSDGLEISWVGRGGGAINSDGHVYFENESDHWGLMYNDAMLHPNGWNQGFPRFHLHDAPDGYRLVRQPLDDGLERIRFTLLDDGNGTFLEQPLFFRWGP